MRRIEFTVRGTLPPKKDGANSMWGKSPERPRLVALRRAASESVGADEPLEKGIRLMVEIHDARRRILTIGDLDNFITGICDGLMACAPRTARLDGWNDDPSIANILPSRCIAIRNDREVVEITARKIGDDSVEPWYRVVLEGT